MRRYAGLAAILLILTVSSAAWCQSVQPGDGQQFQQRKAEILKRMGERIAEIQQRQACVQAANTPDAVRACLPHFGEGHGGQQ